MKKNYFEFQKTASRKYFRLAFLLIAPLLFSNGVNAFVTSYMFSSSPGAYASVAGGRILGTTTNDDQVFNNDTVGTFAPVTNTGFPIGFNFMYNGVTCTKFAVNTNGWIVVGGSGTITIDGSYGPISPVGTGFTNVIAGFAMDLQGQAGSTLSYATLGVTPNRVLIVQWKNYRYYNANGDSVNFQIRLNETTNTVSVMYGKMISVTSFFPHQAQVGLRGNNNMDFNIRRTSSNWSATLAGEVNTDTCLFKPTVYPAMGLTFSWTGPPACSGAPNAGTTVAYPGAVCTGKRFTLSLSGTSNVSGLSYQWQSSPNNTTWTNIATATNTSYNTSQSSATFYRCVVTCGTSPANSTSLQVLMNAPVYCYCDSALQSNVCNNNDIIDSVRIVGTTLNNPSMCPMSGIPYIKFPATGSSTATLNRGSAYTIAVTTTSTNTVSLWIDYNQNGIFEPTEWKQVSASTTPNVPSFVSVNIPGTAGLGLTGMRVRSRRVGSINDSTSACINFRSGETQDYMVTMTYAVGIQEHVVQNSLSVYPNPATEFLTVSFDNPQSGALNIKLLSMTGQEIFAENHKTFTGNYLGKVDLSNVAKGIYFLQIITEKESVTKKVVVE